MATAKPASDFDWTLMRSFLAALDAGSLLGAARGLKQSQPFKKAGIAFLKGTFKPGKMDAEYFLAPKTVLSRG